MSVCMDIFSFAKNAKIYFNAEMNIMVLKKVVQSLKPFRIVRSSGFGQYFRTMHLESLHQFFFWYSQSWRDVTSILALDKVRDGHHIVLV